MKFVAYAAGLLVGLLIGQAAEESLQRNRLEKALERETIYYGGHIYHVIDMGELK